MPNAANVNFSVTNLTQVVSSPNGGMAFVMGRSIRGPFADPSDIINSWPDFVRKFGGIMDDSDAPLLCKQLLEAGGSLRFCRVGHYTDPDISSSLDATLANLTPQVNITFDDEFVTGNSVSLDINGNTIGPVVFDTSHENTMEDLAIAIAADPNVGSAKVMDDDLTILVTSIDENDLTVANITTTGGASQNTGTATSVNGLVDVNNVEVFVLKPKYLGADANNISVEITPASNGNPLYFNLNIYHATDPSLNESYINLNVVGNPTASTANFLSQVVNNSNLLDVEYKDLSSTTGDIVPVPTLLSFKGGSDGTQPVSADYIGTSSAMNGFHAFDEYDDAYNLAVLDNYDDTVMVAGSAYAENRKDLIFFLHLPIDLKTKAALINKKSSYNIDSKFTFILGGTSLIADTITSQNKETNHLGKVLALAAKTEVEFGPWYSFAGPNRGIIRGTLGVIPNYGSPGSFAELNDLANRQINMVINRSNSIKLWGNFSAQQKNDQEKFISIVRLIIFLKKSLRPTLESFLEEPNDIPTWKRIYYTVKPFLDSLVVSRAFYEYQWQGDQDASSLSTLVVNNPTDVGQGIYKVNLLIKAIPSIQEIKVQIVLSPTDVDFEIVDELL